MDSLDQLMPEVVGNPYIPHWPHPPQARFLGLHLQHPSDQVFQALYGGAAGGGKSDALLMAAAQYAWRHPDFAAIIFRRTYTELSRPGAIMDRALQWWVPMGVPWNSQTKTFTFPSGARITFAYMQHEQDHLNYQGAEFQLTCWDELTQFPRESQFSYVGISRVRRLLGSRVPLRTLAASNPGGPGHTWVKDKFIGDPEAGVEAPWPYLPARIIDNPSIDQETYVEGLRTLHPTVRAQLLDGDWRARDPGDYFRAEWFGPLLDPETDRWASSDTLRIRWWDLAASEKESAAKTAGVLMARHRSGVRAVEHCRSFRATPGKRDDLIIQTAKADGPTVIVGLEIEGGSGGPAQFEALSKRLRMAGLRVVGARPRPGSQLSAIDKATLVRNPGSRLGKAGRADPVASCLERGYQRRGESLDTGSPIWGIDENLPHTHHKDGLRLFAGPWTQSYLDVVEGFPDHATCDEVDATSGAWAYLEAHKLGSSTPMGMKEKLKTPHTLSLHPDDRPEETAGRWRP